MFKIKGKKLITLFMVFSMVFTNSTYSFAKGANVPQKQRNMTDEEFLGIWNKEENSWSIEPSINYEYDEGLSLVEKAIKEGNYDEGKKELLQYYRNVNRDKKPSDKEKYTDGQIEMLMEDIYTSSSPIGQSSIPTSKQTINIDVLSKLSLSIKKAEDNFSVLLMGRNKNQEAIFSSRESNQPPTLKLTVDGKSMEIIANSDTYVRAGKHCNENYGKSLNLYVNDSGVPFDDNTKRTYLQFDLSSISPKSKITSANIQLNGYTTNSTNMDLLVFNAEQIVVEEYKKNWANSKTSILSFKGSDGEFQNLPFLGSRVGVDQQYHNTMSRFWYFMRLVGAYRATNDEKYAQKFLEEIISYYSKFGGGDLLLKINDRDYNDTLNAGFRLDMTVIAYWALVDSESMTPDINLQYLKFLFDDAEFLSHPNTFWNHGSKNNNWGMNQTMGIVEVLTYFPEFSTNRKQLSEVAEKMEFLLNKLIREDGSYIEANNGYPVHVLDDIIIYKENMEKIGYKLPASLDSMLKKFARYFMNAIEPNGYLAEYGDDKYNFSEDLLQNLEKLGVLFNDNDLIYIGSQGKRGEIPKHTSIAYPDGEIMISRNGWNSDDIFMFSNWKPFETHSHNDALNLTLSAYGRRLLVDTSDRSYNDEFISNWQRKSRQSHNVVEIDGTTSYTGWGGDASQKLFSNGSTIISNSHDIMNASYTEKRNDGMYTQNRNIVFIKPLKLFLVSDFMESPEGNHEYKQNWHMAPDANIKLSTNKAAQSQFLKGGNIQVIPADKEKLKATIENGYYHTTTHKYVSYYQKADENAVYDTVLYPYEEGDNTIVNVNRIDMNVKETTASAINVELKREDGTIEKGDYYISHEECLQKRKFGDKETDARLAYVHNNKKDEISYALINEGKTLKSDNIQLISSQEEIQDLSLEYTSNSLDINSQQDIKDMGKLTIYAPQHIKNVKFNGDNIKCIRDGNKIIINAKEEVPSPQKTIIVNEDFDDMNIGNKPSDWSIKDTVSIQKVNLLNNKALKLEDKSGTSTSSARKFFESQSGNLEVEFNMMTSNPNLATYLKLYSDNTEVVRLKLEKSNLTYLMNNHKFSTNLQNMKPNNWYKIKVIGDTDNNKCKIYIDGELKLEEEFILPIKNINSFQISTQSFDKGYSSYIDDLLISTTK